MSKKNMQIIIVEKIEHIKVWETLITFYMDSWKAIEVEKKEKFILNWSTEKANSIQSALWV